MNKKIETQIRELEDKANQKRKEIAELDKQIYRLYIQGMDIDFGSVLSRTSTCPFYETERDEYLIILSKDRKVLFINTCYWMSDYEFESLKEAKEFIMQNSECSEYEWKLEMIRGEFNYWKGAKAYDYNQRDGM